MNSVSKFLCFLLLCITPVMQAQLPHGGKPSPYTSKKSSSAKIILSDFSLQKAIEESLSEDAVSGKKPFRFAWNYTLKLSPGNSGVWMENPDGTRIWRVHLVSEGAYGVNVDFSRFNLQEGCTVFLYPPSQETFLGGFNHLNNNNSDYLPTGFIAGEEVVVELQVEKGIKNFGEIEIGSLAHAYIDIFNRKDGHFGKSGSCNVDINCPEGQDWQVIKKAICRIIFKSGNSTELCTGTLINNTNKDTIPYLLTANHCLRLASHASSAVFYFDYESAECGGTDDTLFYSLAGSTLLATSDSIDFTLLKLNESPPKGYKPYYAGWSRSQIPATSSVAIHHPQGDVKKISISGSPVTAEYQSPVPTNLSWLYNESLQEAFWRVVAWDKGTTEGGSSGAPLFNQNRLVIGNLTGGEASCSNSVNDYFSKFSLGWDHYPAPGKQLKYWLDPNNTGVVNLLGFNPFGEPDTLTDTTEYAPRFTLFPNPAWSNVTFETDTMDITGGTLCVYTLTGSKIACYAVSGTPRLTFDVSFLSEGMYIVEFSKGIIRERKRLMVIKP